NPNLQGASLLFQLKMIQSHHLNKKHWNSIILDGRIPTADIKEMINESYDLVLQSLSKKLRNNLSA
nr:MmcQ/YjbR family DNA-binding protein [Candidatus Neomarinimicrobiota bacterium]